VNDDANDLPDVLELAAMGKNGRERGRDMSCEEERQLQTLFYTSKCLSAYFPTASGGKFPAMSISSYVATVNARSKTFRTCGASLKYFRD
jgi:hypothetical protein